jgi:Protein of unknown function (DUF1257)
MSHFSRIATKIRDRQTLVRCLEEMGYEVREAGTIQGYHGREQVDLFIQTGRGYAIGFRKNEQGTFEIVADWWGVKGADKGRFIEDLQKSVNRIQREYALKMVMEQSERQGYALVEQEEEGDGSIRIVMRRWN